MSVAVFMYHQCQKVPLIVVYNYKNKPEMINHEYAPWTNNYKKIISKYDQINKNILKNLNKN